jgi:AcrR family transcriptional regulator
MNPSTKALDLRVQRTNKFLWDALISLMAERDFETLTVTEICERAMVHRTTFYKHYEDKYALLHQGLQAQLELLFQELNLPAGEAVETATGSDYVPFLITIFEHVLRHKPVYHLMLCGDSTGKFQSLLGQLLVEEFLKRSEAHSRRDEERILMRSTLRAHSHAGLLVSTIAWWLEHDCPYTPDEMGQFLLEDAFS